MGNSLKDALLKAGLNSSKKENEREVVKGKQKKAESVQHQQSRNYCEHCSAYQPDVEHYRHHNPTTEAEWICVACADKLMIGDDNRVTNQSDFSKQGNFIRYFGHTKKFDQNRVNNKTPQRNRNKNGNQ